MQASVQPVTRLAQSEPDKLALLGGRPGAARRPHPSLCGTFSRLREKGIKQRSSVLSLPGRLSFVTPTLTRFGLSPRFIDLQQHAIDIGPRIVLFEVTAELSIRP